MDTTVGRRVHFSVIATTTPKLLIDAGTRQCAVIYNGSGQDIRIGVSGSLSSLGVLIDDATPWHDLYSSDEWWVVTSSGSGTVSGYVVI